MRVHVGAGVKHSSLDVAEMSYAEREKQNQKTKTKHLFLP